MTKIWKIIFSETAQKQLTKLDKSFQFQIRDYIHKRLISSQNPKILAKPLKGNLGGFWRFRVGDYRLIVDIQEQTLVIQILQIGHRRGIYH